MLTPAQAARDLAGLDVVADPIPAHALCGTTARNFLAGVYLAAAIIWLD
jgi:hypothetical protein